MLADTNVVSELMKRRPSPAVVRWASEVGPISVSAVTIEEIVFGLERRPSPALAVWFDAFVRSRCSVLAVTEAVARRGARLRALRESAGRPATQADMLIAATAMEHALILATRNVRDFDGCGVRVVNPFDE